jgi:predicted nucleic acid-binding protein
MIYLLDTNIISEVMRAAPDENVRRWFANVGSARVFVPVIALSEIVFGIERLPYGRRRAELQAKLDDIRHRSFRKHILDYDEEAAVRCGEIRARAQARGQPATLADAQIAAIALVRSMTVATRDLGDFAGFGVALVDPFDPKAVP